jgi:pyrimidine-nucleoside phosphorylase/thymidine phosphorylase
MSKKLAEGIDALVLDVKVGTGAFMKTRADARELAVTMARIGRGMGKRVTALLTAMEEPLGRAVGNALEVAEAVEMLRGGGPDDFRAVTVELTAEMLLLAGAARDLPTARRRVEAAVADGSGLARLREIVRAQGGDPAAVDDLRRLPRAERVVAVPSPGGGFVEAIDAEEIGLAAMALGAGRARVEDAVDPAVGIVLARKVGDPVAPGEPLCELHCGSGGTQAPEAVGRRVAAAYRLGPRRPEPAPLIIERIAEDGT